MNNIHQQILLFRENLNRGTGRSTKALRDAMELCLSHKVLLVVVSRFQTPFWKLRRCNNLFVISYSELGHYNMRGYEFDKIVIDDSVYSFLTKEQFEELKLLYGRTKTDL